MRKIFHLEIKATNNHSYYGDLAAVFRTNKKLFVSKFTLDRWDWSKEFENGTCIIRKSNIEISKRKAKKAQAKKPKNNT